MEAVIPKQIEQARSLFDEVLARTGQSVEADLARTGLSLLSHIDTQASELERLRRCLVREQDIGDKLTERLRKAEAELEGLRERLAEHFPVEIRCDHEAKTDVIACDCGCLTTPESSLQRAKLAWARHALSTESVPAREP